MVKIKFIKKSKRMMSVIALALLFAIGFSLFYVNKKLEEKQRSREYEVSLVKTLKNSYAVSYTHLTLPTICSV